MRYSLGTLVVVMLLSGPLIGGAYWLWDSYCLLRKYGDVKMVNTLDSFPPRARQNADGSVTKKHNLMKGRMHIWLSHTKWPDGTESEVEWLSPAVVDDSGVRLP